MKKIYSKEIKRPKTTREGFENFVQRIINHIEADNHREALLVAVDLLDEISSGSSSYQEILDYGENKLITALKRQHAAEISTAVDNAKQFGISEGRRLEKQELAKKLNLI